MLQAIAHQEDQKAILMRTSASAVSKELVTMTTCFGAVGIGKTAIAQAGLEACRRWCQDPDLQDLLRSDKHSLGLMISFNGSTTVSEAELLGGSSGLAASRRLFAEYFGLSLGEANTIPLSQNYTVTDCLRVLAADHRQQHDMDPDQQLFIYVAVDDINLLVRDTAESKSRLQHVKEICKELQVAGWGGVINCFVAVVLAGTNYLDMKDAFLGSNIKPFPLYLRSLTQEQLTTIMLKDAHVDSQYLTEPKFQESVLEIGPTLRPYGEFVSGLDFRFNSSSIHDAKVKALRYFNKSAVSLTAAESLKLHALAATGLPQFARSPLVEGSAYTLESLEVDGFLQLVRTSEEDEYVTVDVPQLNLRTWSSQNIHKLTMETHRVANMFTVGGWQMFEQFVLHYHCLRMNFLSYLYPDRSFTMAEFYNGAVIIGHYGKLLLKLPVNHHCQAIDHQGTHLLGPNEDIQTVDRLRMGDAMRDSAGAKTDLVAVYNVQSPGSAEWSELVCLMHAAHTIGESVLTMKKIESDREKNVISQSKHFKTSNTFHVHVSNRDLPTNITEKTGVFIGKAQCRPFFGHLFGRLVTSPSVRRQYSTSVRSPPVGPSGWAGTIALVKRVAKMW